MTRKFNKSIDLLWIWNIDTIKKDPESNGKQSNGKQSNGNGKSTMARAMAMARAPWQEHHGKSTMARAPWQEHHGKSTMARAPARAPARSMARAMARAQWQELNGKTELHGKGIF